MVTLTFRSQIADTSLWAAAGLCWSVCFSPLNTSAPDPGRNFVAHVGLGEGDDVRSATAQNSGTGRALAFARVLTARHAAQSLQRIRPASGRPEPGNAVEQSAVDRTRHPADQAHPRPGQWHAV